MTEKDPFTQVYDAMWGIIERSTTLMELIPEGNRIKFTQEARPKTAISNADTPELAILAGGAQYGINNDSHNRGCRRDYIVVVTTGDFRLNPLFHPIMFEIWRAALDWESTFCSLKWHGCKFVTDFQLIESEEGDSREEQNRGFIQWSSLITAQIQFNLPISKLRLTI